MSEDDARRVAACLLDRDRWYLVSRDTDRSTHRSWRADRVLAIAPSRALEDREASFDIRSVLNRAWLKAAMDEWRERSPVTLRLTQEQAEILHDDWYYGRAQFQNVESGAVTMRYGEDDPVHLFRLLRWLGPGAELVAPRDLRGQRMEELKAMLRTYQQSGDP